MAPVLRRVVERLEHEAPPEDRAKLLTATYVLTGLRVSRELAEQLFQGVHAMKESSTYQAILEEGWTKGRSQGLTQGRTEALQKTLMRQGRHRFDAPTEAVQARITAITDVERLERMTEQLLTVSGWQELLETP